MWDKGFSRTATIVQSPIEKQELGRKDIDENQVYSEDMAVMNNEQNWLAMKDMHQRECQMFERGFWIVTHARRIYRHLIHR